MNINQELSYSRNKKLIKVNQFLLSEFKFLEILISYNIFPSEKKRKMAVKLWITKLLGPGDRRSKRQINSYFSVDSLKDGCSFYGKILLISI